MAEFTRSELHKYKTLPKIDKRPICLECGESISEDVRIETETGYMHIECFYGNYTIIDNREKC